MQASRRTAASAARTTRTTLSRSQRRFAHDEHAHSHGHGHAQANESFGKGFWLTAAAVPTGYALYAISRQDPNAPGFLTRLIDQYTQKQEKLLATNALHTAMMEQAGSDRVLFMNTTPQTYVDMKFPEIMNAGSPYNVPAGSQVNMDKVIAKYKKEAYEDNERKLEALRNGTIRAEQPLEQSVPRYRQVELNRAIR